MSAINTPDATEHQPQAEALGKAAAGVAARRGAGRAPQTWSIGRAIDAFLGLLSAVPFGISLLVLLITACMIGMLIQQVELEPHFAFAVHRAGKIAGTKPQFYQQVLFE
jgi:hypothetical protein